MNCSMIYEGPDPTCTFNEWHLGDNLIHLNWLRRVALENPARNFEHFLRGEDLGQCLQFVSDAPNIRLLHISEKPEGAIDAWKAAGGFFDGHPLKKQWVPFHLEWFAHLAKQIGVNNPITRPEHLLMDSPAVQKPCAIEDDFDVLVLNSKPMSRQFSPWTPWYLDPVILALGFKGHRIITTNPSSYQSKCTKDVGITAAGVGNLSLRCKLIIAVATGIHFPTWNIWNTESVELRIVLIDNGETHVGMPGKFVEATTREDVMEILKATYFL